MYVDLQELMPVVSQEMNLSGMEQGGTYKL